MEAFFYCIFFLLLLKMAVHRSRYIEEIKTNFLVQQAVRPVPEIVNASNCI